MRAATGKSRLEAGKPGVQAAKADPKSAEFREIRRSMPRDEQFEGERLRISTNC